MYLAYNGSYVQKAAGIAAKTWELSCKVSVFRDTA